MAFDTRNVFLNLSSVYVSHTFSNHPLLRGSRRHDRSAVVFSEEIRRAERKKTSNNNIRLTVKRKRIFCCISFLLLLEFCKSFTSSNLRWRLRCGAIFVTAYRCTDYCANPELSSTLARRLNWSRACAVLLSNPILIRFCTLEARRMNWTLVYSSYTFLKQPFHGNDSTLDSHTNTVISHGFAYSSRWRGKPDKVYHATVSALTSQWNIHWTTPFIQSELNFFIPELS